MLDRLSFPQPWLSVILFIIWQLLSEGISGGSLALGFLLAWIIPQMTQSFWPNRPAFAKPWRMPAYVLRVIKDIVVASVEVSILILSPRKPKPAFIIYPLKLQHPLAITILASTISLTPGTVIVDISDDNKALLIHALDAKSSEELIDEIWTRYEKPLLEMFE